MFGKFKKFAGKKLIESQLKNVPKEQQEMIMTMYEKDPKLLEQIAKEIQEEQKKGSSQTQAAMKVMPKYQAQLQKLMGNQMPQQGGGGAKGFNPNGSIRR